MSGRGIYVETAIRASLDEVWRLTQEPGVHQRWDLRFSTIEYLPREAGEPQRFLYATRLGFGLDISGEGESVGTVESERERTSALHFWSDSGLSLIRDGRGYWKYMDGARVRFFTWYDYDVRWGWLGRAIDAVCFRPLIGWATAWSFDRLRLWAEDGVRPEDTLRMTAAYTIARLSIVFVWLWHGLVPKLLLNDVDERYLVAAQHLPVSFVHLAGAAEIVLALVGLAFWRWRGYFVLTAILMACALLSVALVTPEFLGRAFNPVTLNLTVATLCAVGYLSSPGAAFAGRCRRAPAKKEVR